MAAFIPLYFKRAGVCERWSARAPLGLSQFTPVPWFAIYKFHPNAWWLRVGQGMGQDAYPVRSLAAGIHAASLYINLPTQTSQSMELIISEYGLGRIDKRTRYK